MIRRHEFVHLLIPMLPEIVLLKCSSSWLARNARWIDVSNVSCPLKYKKLNGSNWIRVNQNGSYWITLHWIRHRGLILVLYGSDWINAGQDCWRKMLGESLYFETNGMNRIRWDHIGPTQLRLADTKCSVNQRKHSTFLAL